MQLAQKFVLSICVITTWVGIYWVRIDNTQKKVGAWPVISHQFSSYLWLETSSLTSYSCGLSCSSCTFYNKLLIKLSNELRWRNHRSMKTSAPTKEMKSNGIYDISTWKRYIVWCFNSKIFDGPCCNMYTRHWTWYTTLWIMFWYSLLCTACSYHTYFLILFYSVHSTYALPYFLIHSL